MKFKFKTQIVGYPSETVISESITASYDIVKLTSAKIRYSKFLSKKTLLLIEYERDLDIF